MLDCHHDRPRRAWLSLSVASLASLPACGSAEAPPPGPRLVLLSATCTLNKDYLSPYNDRVEFTPALAELASQSVVFARHQTEAGQSGIAYASIFSGTQADHHGAYRHPVTLSDRLYLIAEAFADAGYETFFWNGHELAGPNYGQGVPASNLFKVGLQPKDPHFVAILERLRSDPNYRAFVMTNYSKTHGPYSGRDRTTRKAKDRDLRRYLEAFPSAARGLSWDQIQATTDLFLQDELGLARNFEATVERMGLSDEQLSELIRVQEMRYESCVRALDRHVGNTVKRIDAYGLRDQSLIAFTADHGEVLYRENAPFQWSHALMLAPEVLSVPLMIRSPDPSVSPHVYENVTRSIDLFPTLAALSGITLPEDSGVQGVDLSAAMKQQEPEPELTAFSHTSMLVRGIALQMNRKKHRGHFDQVRKFFPDEEIDHIWVSLREGDLFARWRNLDGTNWGFELFDLSRDDEEATDLFDPEQPEHQAFAQLLRSYKAHLVACKDRSSEEDLLPETDEMERLRGLGYVK